MKKQILFFSLMSFLLLCGPLSLIAQMPAAIDVQPVNASVYDEITLTLTIGEACFDEGSLMGAAYVGIHSGVTVNGNAWQKVIPFDGTGANGQSPTLNFVSEGVYAITYTPADFYGILPTDVVTQICAVFNNGNDWTQDARDFQPGGSGCQDFFIPIDPGSPPGDPFLHSIVPNHGDIGEDVSIQVFGLNTHFQSSPTTGWLENGGNMIVFSSVYAINDTLLSAQVSIPGNATIGDWDVKVENDDDDLLTLSDGFTVEDTAIIFPVAITLDPPEPSAYDEITLTLDAKLSCPAGAIINADSVMMHSGLTIDGNAWQYVVNFDGTGANGQVPILSGNGDSTWTIVFKPYFFYGFPANENVEGINCVFNGGDWTAGEAKDTDINGDCIDFFIPLILTTSISPEKENKYSIFPNPVENTLKIKSDYPISNYRIFSIQGNPQIYGKGLSQKSLSVNTTELLPGMYIIEVMNEKNNIERNKFLKK